MSSGKAKIGQFRHDPGVTTAAGVRELSLVPLGARVSTATAAPSVHAPCLTRPPSSQHQRREPCRPRGEQPHR